MIRSKSSWTFLAGKDGGGGSLSPLSPVRTISSGPAKSGEGGPVAVPLEVDWVWVLEVEEAHRFPLKGRNLNVVRGTGVATGVG